jgi:S1-C subfamily serine protease
MSWLHLQKFLKLCLEFIFGAKFFCVTKSNIASLIAFFSQLKSIFLLLILFQFNTGFASLKYSTIEKAKLCNLSIVSSKLQEVSNDIFWEKNLTNKQNDSTNYGSGFFYHLDADSKTQIILTNFHVIQSALNEGLFIFGCNSKLCKEIKPIMIDKEADIAMLTGSEEFECIGDLDFELSPTEGDEIFIYGNKLGLGNSLSHGFVSSANKEVSQNNLVHLLDINAGDGNSGGAVVLANSNKIIGMLKSIYSRGNTSLVFAIPVDTILNSIQKMQNILELERNLEFEILENEKGIYFVQTRDSVFFESIPLTNSDQIHSIDSKFVSSKVEVLHDLYIFLNDESRDGLKVVFISRDGELKSARFIKHKFQSTL